MRTLLPGLSLTLAVLLSPCAHAADAGPPAAPVEVVTDDYYGTPVADPYRWMESGKDERCLLYTSPSPRDQRGSRMPSSA